MYSCVETSTENTQWNAACYSSNSRVIDVIYQWYHSPPIYLSLLSVLILRVFPPLLYIDSRSSSECLLSALLPHRPASFRQLSFVFAVIRLFGDFRGDGHR